MHLRKVLAQALFHPSQKGVVGKTAPTDLFTAVVRPSSGVTLSGGYWLGAQAASDNSPVTRVEFRVTGGSLNLFLIGTAIKSPIGWLSYWNTASIGNGVYRLQSVVYDAAGQSRRSPAISVTVHN
jgi:hypothetical protein